jgi:peptidoglycan/LPS O-acetylase OafA/YrhL
MLLFAAFALFGKHSLVLATLFFLFIGKMLSGNGPGLLFYVAILGGSFIHLITSWLRASPIVSALAVVLGLFLSATDHTTSYAWLTKLPLPNLNPVLPNLNANTTMFWQTVGSWVLVCGVIGCRPFAKFCASAVPAYLGRISFAIYLLHLPLIMSLMIHAMAWGKALGLSFIGSFFFSFALFSITLLVLAELFTRCIDEPAIKLSRRFETWLTRSGPARPLMEQGILQPEATVRPAHQ